MAHVGASFELDDVADEVAQVVQVMSGLNRYRFAADGELLASWESRQQHLPQAAAGGGEAHAGITPTPTRRR